MKATINNFRGIGKAELDIAPIALITGPNGAGKTSIARAIAAAVTGNPLPFGDMTKKDCAVMLRNGAPVGSVTVAGEEGYTTVEWSKGKAEAKSEGRPPHASEIAAGLSDLLSMKKKEALGYLNTLLRASVSEQQFTNALKEKEIGEDVAKKVWLTIEAQGWDAAHARAKETGTKYKGEWERVTGDKYGSVKAATWVPAEWDDTIAGQTHDSLQGDINAARATLEAAIAGSAVDQANLARLQAIADSLPVIEAQKKSGQTLLSVNEAKLVEVEKKLRENPNPNTNKDYECPHCACKVHIKSVSGTEYMLSKAEVIAEDKLKAARKLNAELCGEQQGLQRQISEGKALLQNIDSQIQTANAAIKKVAELKNQPETAQGGDVEAARVALANAESRKRLFDTLNEAMKLAAQIVVNQELIELLDETGLRNKMLTSSLISFLASYVSPLCATIGIPEISIDSDMNVRMGARPFHMCSESEKFRIRTVVQIAVAQVERADLIIIDGADIVEPALRGKLLQTVEQARIPAVMCVTLSSMEKAPNLADMMLGNTYWVAGASCASPFLKNKAA